MPKPKSEVIILQHSPSSTASSCSLHRRTSDCMLNLVAQLDFFLSNNNDVTRTLAHDSGYYCYLRNAGDLAAGCPAGRTSIVRSRVEDPSAFGVGIPSALTHSLGSPLGASLLLGNPPRLAGSIISLTLRLNPRNIPFLPLTHHGCQL